MGSFPAAGIPGQYFQSGDAQKSDEKAVPPLFLIVAVLGPIFAGIASPTEVSAVGAVGAKVG